MSRTWRNLVVLIFGLSMLGIGIYSWVDKSLGDRPFSGIITEFASGNDVRMTRAGSLPIDGVKFLKITSVNGKVKIIPAVDGSEIKYEAVLWAKGSDSTQKLNTINTNAEVLGEIAILEAKHANRSVSNEGVDFVVHLPKGIGLELNLVNGTVEGDVVVNQQRKVAVTLVNGSIDLKLDTTAGADITASLVNGRIKLEPSDRMFDSLSQTPRRTTAQVNGGGTPVTMTTVNGQIRLDLGK